MMKLEDVQNWALVKFGRYSHDYAQVVAAVHPTEEWLGNLMRLLEKNGEGLDIGASDEYLARLRANPQERIP